MACEGSVCSILFNLTRGIIITVVGQSGFVYGPARFIDIDPINCLVTLEEEVGLSPVTTNIIHIDCDNIESVMIPVDTATN